MHDVARGAFGAKLQIRELNFIAVADVGEKRGEHLSALGGGGDLELNEIGGVSHVEVGGDFEAVGDFGEGVVEGLEDGEVPVLDEGARGELEGFPLFFVEVELFDGVVGVRVAVAAVGAVVGDGGVVAEIRIVAHRREVLFNRGNADAFAFAAEQFFFAGALQIRERGVGAAGVAESVVDDLVAEVGLLVDGHGGGGGRGGLDLA